MRYALPLPVLVIVFSGTVFLTTNSATFERADFGLWYYVGADLAWSILMIWIACAISAFSLGLRIYTQRPVLSYTYIALGLSNLLVASYHLITPFLGKVFVE